MEKAFQRGARGKKKVDKKDEKDSMKGKDRKRTMEKSLLTISLAVMKRGKKRITRVQSGKGSKR